MEKSEYRVTLTQFDDELREEQQIKLDIYSSTKKLIFESELFRELILNNVSIKIESL